MLFDLNVLLVFGALFLSFFFVLLFALLCQMLLYKSTRRAAEQTTSRTMGLNELKALIEEATHEATLPLENRVASLEAEVADLDVTVARMGNRETVRWVRETGARAQQLRMNNE